jgi:hypothetical protein
MSRTSLLCGLNVEDSTTAIWKLLFSPSLRKQVGTENSFRWCEELIAAYSAGNEAAFSSQYTSMAAQVRALSAGEPRPSMENPPWSMISLDMAVGIIPWVSPLFDRFLFLLLSTGSVIDKRSGAILPVAYILSGGPGDSKDSAIRICAPNNVARVSAEYWLMRAFLWNPKLGAHFTLAPDENGRQFSLHRYEDTSGNQKSVYFETTDSLGQEAEDFIRVLHAR